MAALVGGPYFQVQAPMERNFFDQLQLGRERRYDSLTNRYGIKIFAMYFYRNF